MDRIKIKGFKSIKNAEFDLCPINILIGANGSGKSNFLTFFEFLAYLYQQKLQEYVALNGGVEKMLFQGIKVTEKIEAMLAFDGGINGYSFSLVKGETNFAFESEKLGYNSNYRDIANYETEANIKNSDIQRAKYIRNYLENIKKYHFHDTGKNSPFNQMSHIENDSYFLYEKGNNLAAFLYTIQKEYLVVYKRIVKIIQSIAPYFSDFYLQPNKENYIRLQWQDKYSNTIYGVNDLSDGTIRFIALVVLFMQPNLPQSLIIDEPELGLHPVAIAKLAGMIKSIAGKGTQVIVATQSTDLVSHFEPEDIITVNQENGKSVFNRLNTNALKHWLSEYSLGDLWKRNIIESGQP